MRKSVKNRWILGLCLLAGTFGAAGTAMTGNAMAADWPVRPVKVVVGFTPGGPTDLVGRLIAQKLSEQTGKNFYVENVPGAGGNVGAVRVAQSAPDGYTILVTGGNITNNPFLFAQAGYDPIKDFEAVALVAATPGRARDQSDGAGENSQGTGRLDSRQSRQGELRIARHRHAAAACRRAVRAFAESRSGACAVRRRRHGG